MRRAELIWLPIVVHRMERQHNLTQNQVEEMFTNQPNYRYLGEGHLFASMGAAFGRANDGRHITVIFTKKSQSEMMIISARDMNWTERDRYL